MFQAKAPVDVPLLARQRAFSLRSRIMTVHKSRPATTTHGHPPAAAKDAPDVPARQEPTYQTSAAQPDSQAERSVLHPEWHDPEWRYYHGAWGG